MPATVRGDPYGCETWLLPNFIDRWQKGCQPHAPGDNPGRFLVLISARGRSASERMRSQWPNRESNPRPSLPAHSIVPQRL